MKSLLKNRNFILYWCATTFSMSASNIVQFVLALYVLDCTGSGAIFAGMLSIVVVPRLLFTPIAGVGGDRWDKRRMMMILLLCATLVLGMFAGMYKAFNDLSVLSVFILVILLEVVETLYNGPGNAVIPAVVDSEELTPANSLAFVNDAIVGIFAPLIGGLVYGFAGIFGGLCAAAIANVVALGLISGMRLPKTVSQQSRGSMVGDFNSGLKLIRAQNFLRRFVMFNPLINFFVTPVFTVSLVYVLRQKMGFSAEFYGITVSVISLISLSVPVLLMGKFRHLELLRVMPGGMVTLLVGLIAIFAGECFREMGLLSTPFSLALIFGGTIVALAISILFNVLGNSLIGSIIPIEYMARTRSTMMLIATVSVPLGQMVFGFFLDRVMPFWTMLFAVLGTALCAGLSRLICRGDVSTDGLKSSISDVVQELESDSVAAAKIVRE